MAWRMDAKTTFRHECDREIAAMGEDQTFRNSTRAWMDQANSLKYSYHFSALGRPIIQYPQDMVAVQEIIWNVKPDLIIETGIAHGGSLILSASMLALIDYCEAVGPFDPRASKRKVLGVDVDIRAHNRAAIEAHPLAHKIEMTQGSSIDPEIVHQVHRMASEHSRILVFLDSNHTHEHVLAELEAYAPLTSVGSYCVAFDTVIDDMPASMFPDRPWGPDDNPKTAVREYLRILASEGRTAADGKPLKLAVDHELESKLAITVAPEGYLVRV